MLFYSVTNALRRTAPFLALVYIVGCGLSPAGTAPAGMATESGSGDGNGGGGGGAAGSGGSSGGAAPESLCGNGIIEAGEECDDGNLEVGDGCTSCVLDKGFICGGEPTVCAPIMPQLVSASPPNGVAIPDGTYNGTLNSMACVLLTVPDAGYKEIQHVEVAIAIQHAFVGDLVIKAQSPKGTITTLMNRPGVAEPVDSWFESPNGDDSNLDAGHPVLFRDGEAISAEAMGAPLGVAGVVCRDDGICNYNPARGLGEGMAGLADFNGESPVGTWVVCVGDGDDGDAGKVTAVALSVLSY